MRINKKNLKCSSLYWIFFFVSLPLNGFSIELEKLHHLENQGAEVSALVVNLSKKTILAQLNPSKRLSPASVSKLVLAADALDTWDEDKSFTSKIFMRGHLSNGVLDGDLIFYGAGDSYLTNEKLWFLTTDVRRFGIKKITGKIIVNTSLFGKVIEDSSRASRKRHSKNAYDAPLSAAAVNFSVAGIVINTPSQGNPILALEPYEIPSIKIENRVSVSSANSKPKISVERISQSNGIDTFIVSGSMPRNAPTVRIYKSISNADVYAGEVIDAFLNHAQVETPHEIFVESTPPSSKDILVSQVEGFPLSWQLKGLFEMSNNFIADTLLLDLALEKGIGSKGNLKSAGNELESYMGSILKESHWGKNTSSSDLILESGSGLTPQNRLSAQDLVAVLDHMYRNENRFPSFLAALPQPGGTGTLKKRFSHAQKTAFSSSLRAKTGTLSEPVDVISLAGYSRMSNGDWVAFAVAVNGTPSKPSLGADRAKQAIDSDLESLY